MCLSGYSGAVFDHAWLWGISFFSAFQNGFVFFDRALFKMSFGKRAEKVAAVGVPHTCPLCSSSVGHVYVFEARPTDWRGGPDFQCRTVCAPWVLFQQLRPLSHMPLELNTLGLACVISSFPSLSFFSAFPCHSSPFCLRSEASWKCLGISSPQSVTRVSWRRERERERHTSLRWVRSRLSAMWLFFSTPNVPQREP